LELVQEYIANLTLSINHALSLSYRRNPYDASSSTFVAHISLVKGVPFYGYTVGYRYFLKVYLLNPLNMTRLADLLLQGAILARSFQPHESHMQYLAQWMCDYNLFGCGFIDCERVRFRSPVPEHAELSNPIHKWHDQSILKEWISDPDQYSRQSHCAVEIDVCVQDILNRMEIRPRHLHHDFMERYHELGPDEKFVHSMAGLWRDETKRRKKLMGLTSSSSSPFPPDVLISMSADVRDHSSGWIHEDEYREHMLDLVDQERKFGPERKIDFEAFADSSALKSKVQTAHESIEDLYPSKLNKQQSPMQHLKTGSFTSVFSEQSLFVDEDSIHQDDIGNDGYNSGEEENHEHALHFDASPNLMKESNGEHPDSPQMSSSREETDERRHGTEHGKTAASDSPLKSRSNLKRQNSQNEDILQELAIIKRRKLYNLPDKTTSLRLDPEMPEQAKPVKRSHVAFDDVLTIGHQYREEDYHGAGDLSSSQLSQSSIKAHGIDKPSTLSFPVVKNAHDRDTELGLSQQSEPANSQTSVHTPSDKIQTSVSSDSPFAALTMAKESPVNRILAERSPIISSTLLSAAGQMRIAFPDALHSQIVIFARQPPTIEEVSGTMLQLELPPVIYQDAYYSDEKDVPDRPREYAGKEFKLESNSVPFLPDFDATGLSPASFGNKPPVIRDKVKEELLYNRQRKRCSFKNWEIAEAPPLSTEVKKWLAHEEAERKARMLLANQDRRRSASQEDLSQIDGPTQKNKHGFKYSQKEQSTSVQHETQYMSIMSLEVHVNTRGNLAPDPEHDEIGCIFWSLQADDDVHTDVNVGFRNGVLVLSSENGTASRIQHQVSVDVRYEEDELELINHMINIVRHYDPDILTGFEVHNGSWGYLIERARLKYEYNICDEFSRMKSQSHGRFGKDADRWGFTHTSTIRVTGRHMINVWRAMRGELNLLQYTMENVAFHVLHKRIPHYSFADLTRWYQSSKPRDLGKVISYFLGRAQVSLEILNANELIPRTSEQARLLGVDFFSVFSRGSQFKVESLMFRIAKPENYILVSPSRKQVGQQNALECLPLVMEPQSNFYPSPLLVLDFQSLYPSVMIAYNYCYSTCLGRAVPWRGGVNKMGFTDFKREPRLLELVKDHINIAPNGMMYVRPELRKSLLAKMLSEILETRVMVKSGMKQDKDDKVLQILLNNRQLALKLIANVTYGYTSASFSGRMPCAEIADSIVQTARETLEKAIALIHSVERWGAEVVYGDTDSLFVYLKGRTKDEAFKIGKEIADTVTNQNPRPVKLKFEKVYHPCVLLAKKRYVGFKYEHPDQKEPEFDAKGIETVRRDGTPAEQKIEETALKILFRTQDLSEVKAYFQKQCHKIMTGRVSIQDFLFAREVRLGSYSDKGPPPPGALIATRKMLQDPRQEPQYGERVPFVVITGAPGARLIDRCVDPERLLTDDSVELDAEYYISKNLIPPLERIFNLVGANVRGWYDEMPKIQRVRNTRAHVANVSMTSAAKKTLESYLSSTMCLVCKTKLPPPPPVSNFLPNQPLPLPICDECADTPARSMLTLRSKLHKEERKVVNVGNVCRSCAGFSFGETVPCDSRDCPVFYTRIREQAALRSLEDRLDPLMQELETIEYDGRVEW